MTYVSALIFSGIIWLIAALCFALFGIHYSLLSVKAEGVITASTHIQLLSLYTFSTIGGYLVGRFILRNWITLFMRHICKYEEPLGLKQVLPSHALSLLFTTCSLVFLIRLLPIPLDAKATLDLAIGIAYIHGAYSYFEKAKLFSRELP